MDRLRWGAAAVCGGGESKQVCDRSRPDDRYPVPTDVDVRGIESLLGTWFDHGGDGSPAHSRRPDLNGFRDARV
jgi:hypothetical protein